jgi:hypothetical protein
MPTPLNLVLQTFGIEIMNADAEVIDASGLLAILQDDQPSTGQNPCLSGPCTRWLGNKPKEVSVEHFPSVQKQGLSEKPQSLPAATV